MSISGKSSKPLLLCAAFCAFSFCILHSTFFISRAAAQTLHLGTRTFTTTQKTVNGTPVIHMWEAPMPTGDISKAAGFPLLKDAQHYTVWQPASRRDGAYNHHAALIFHDGLFYAMWANHWDGEGCPGQRILYSTSKDARSWMPATEVFPPPGLVLEKPPGIHLAPDRWVVADGKLYAVVYVMGAGTYPVAREVAGDGTFGEPFLLSDLPKKAALPNFMPSPSKHLILAEKINKWYKDNDTVSWWAQDTGEVPSRGVDGARLVEPFTYRSKNGLVLLMRDSTKEDGNNSRLSNRMYVSFPDGKGIWSNAYPTDIPDAPSRAQALRLTDGRVLLVGNQIAPRFDTGHYMPRDPLTLSVSPDGELFTKVYALRMGAPPKPVFSGITGRKLSLGFGYPSMIIHNGMIYVLYSINKEDMAITIAPLSSIE